MKVYDYNAMILKSDIRDLEYQAAEMILINTATKLFDISKKFEARSNKEKAEEYRKWGLEISDSLASFTLMRKELKLVYKSWGKHNYG